MSSVSGSIMENPSKPGSSFLFGDLYVSGKSFTWFAWYGIVVCLDRGEPTFQSEDRDLTKLLLQQLLFYRVPTLWDDLRH